MDREKFLEPFDGSIGKCVEETGLSQGFISQCLTGKKKWPIKRIAEMNEKFGIPKYVLRPDLYPVPKQEQCSTV